MAMEKKTDFKLKYPISLTAAIFYPLIYEVWNNLSDLPGVKLKCIINFCHYAGYNDGAVRTAISRLKKKGILISTDDKQKAGYKLNKIQRMRTIQMKDEAIQQGFTLAVFSFNRENERERYIIRSILTKTGFKKFAQNTYINTRGRKDELLRKIKNEDLEKHLFIFECEDDLDENTILRMIEIWKINSRVNLLNQFFSDLQAFAIPDGLSKQEIFNMFGYAGSVFVTRFQHTEPPVPGKYLPADYPIKKIYNFLLEKNHEFLENTKSYFIEVNG